MNIDLSFLLEKENMPTDVDASYEGKSITIRGCEYPITAVEPFKLTFYNDEGKKLFVSGKTSALAVCPCDRCLSDVEISVPVSVNEELDIKNDTFSYNEEEGVTLVEENTLLLDDLIANEILMNWPAKVLCGEDCKGICPVCGVNRNEKDCGCDTVVLDPKMQQFQDVFKDFKEV